jgi:hypothetical protein
MKSLIVVILKNSRKKYNLNKRTQEKFISGIIKTKYEVY